MVCVGGCGVCGEGVVCVVAVMITDLPSMIYSDYY